MSIQRTKKKKAAKFNQTSFIIIQSNWYFYLANFPINCLYMNIDLLHFTLILNLTMKICSIKVILYIHIKSNNCAFFRLKKREKWVLILPLKNLYLNMLYTSYYIYSYKSNNWAIFLLKKKRSGNWFYHGKIYIFIYYI